jgi:hypothetical protein
MIPIKSIASESLFTGKVNVRKVKLIAGAANASVDLYDNTSATGTELTGLKALASSSDEIDFGKDGLDFSTAIFSSISGSGAKVFVYLN